MWQDGTVVDSLCFQDYDKFQSLSYSFALCDGKQVQNERYGSGYVVVDVRGESTRVWQTLLDFDR